jgi:glycogen operon protein
VGTNFAVFSEHATAIEICLFGADPATPLHVIPLPERNDYVWHGWIEGCGPGTKYGIRAHGTYNPEQGQRFNPAKLLLDPYARAIDGKVDWDSSLYGYDQSDPEDDLAIDNRANDARVPKSLVVDDAFDWGDDAHPRTPWLESVIYEAHIKGLTKLHPGVPEELRGTYLGACQPVIIEHLKRLGVTAIELLPVHAHVDDQFLVQRGLSNYWGYSTLGYFAPHPAYASQSGGREVAEFKEMVKAFHAAGIEVILDVVYNHSCEGNHHGPTLSFRGLDNVTYYHLLPDKPEYYLDFTGTGNSIKAAHPQTLTLILDSLRYWVKEMHVDGFRFDLATTIGRELYEFDAWGGFFDAVHQDPLLRQVKLIAEPWDIGEGGYQVGGFPVLWSEWNDKFRDAVRSYWQTNVHDIAEMGYRLTGSSDVYEPSGRGPRASVNLITAHDGFTLADVVSYSEKHNEANGEGGMDGHAHNLSANYGVEGPTDDPAITALRWRQKRNMLATLMLSQGVPMILGGDEFGRTQNGNNNAYCQDNEVSWFDWEHDEPAKQLTEYVAHLASIRRDHPLLRRRRFFDGRPATPDSMSDISWIRADGQEMVADDWWSGSATLGFRMAGDAIDETDAEGGAITSPTLMMIVHAGEGDIAFTLPAINRDTEIDTWEVILNSDSPTGKSGALHKEQEVIDVPARTVLLLMGRLPT